MNRLPTAIFGFGLLFVWTLAGCNWSSGGSADPVVPNGASNKEATSNGNASSTSTGDGTNSTDSNSAPSKDDSPTKEKSTGDSTSKSPVNSADKAADGDPVAVTFDDLNLNMQADIVYRPWMLTDRAKELDGRRIRVTGVMLGAGVSQQKNLKDFVLLKNKECKFGPGGQADHLLHVFYRGEKPANFTQSSIEIEGVLKINPYQGPDGNTWSVYDLDATTYKELRR